MVEELLDELARLGVMVVASGDRLKFYPRKAVSPELVERLKEHKAEVLVVMAEPWPEAEPEPEPCGKCGGLELWETPMGNWRCMKCDPPERARRLLEKAERLRQKVDKQVAKKTTGQ